MNTVELSELERSLSIIDRAIKEKKLDIQAYGKHYLGRRMRIQREIDALTAMTRELQRNLENHCLPSK